MAWKKSVHMIDSGYFQMAGWVIVVFFDTVFTFSIFPKLYGEKFLNCEGKRTIVDDFLMKPRIKTN